MKDLLFEDDPGLDGPDYVALVIEWDELADSIEHEITAQTQPLPRPRAEPRRAVFAIGMLGVITLAAWGIHRLRRA